VQIDNIIVGNLVEGLTEEQIGISPSEDTIRLSVEQATNDKGDLFLPNILKTVGLFKSTSEIRKINDQRLKSDKFKKDPDQNLWRICIRPEMTSFKIGKRVFWLIIGEE
jgi:hypothetical protein